ncbi:unnamed protein product [Phyllotreta striolata]|uniref:Uncharacterized protein n=1 Tax=Phyllotreta striolata TaxID=444603 RepID=A0A9N9XSP3_PHYSR|nr:unnamed protein product [Phyllotreta striolata]
MANAGYFGEKGGIMKIVEILLAISIIAIMESTFSGFGCKIYMALVGLIVSLIILLVNILVEPDWPWHCWILIIVGIFCLIDGFFDMIDMIINTYYFYRNIDEVFFIIAFILKIILGVVYVFDGLLTRGGGE